MVIKLFRHAMPIEIENLSGLSLKFNVAEQIARRKRSAMRSAK